MQALAKRPQASLPIERHYRPLPRRRFFSRGLPLALAAGAVAAALVLAAPVDPLLSVLAIWAAAIFRLVGQRRRAHAMIRDNDEGQALLAAGDIEHAAEIFERLCRHARGLPALHAVFVYNRGVAYLRNGDISRAECLFQAVLTAGWFTHRASLFMTYLPLLYAGLGTCRVLAGDMATAETWRRRAHEVSSEARRGALLALDVLLDARRGELEHVVEAVERQWDRAENLLTASQLRLVRLIKAFALERLKTAYRGDSSTNELRECIAAGRPARASEVRHIALHWPEFADFLGRHGIDTSDHRGVSR